MYYVTIVLRNCNGSYISSSFVVSLCHENVKDWRLNSSLPQWHLVLLIQLTFHSFLWLLLLLLLTDTGSLYTFCSSCKEGYVTFESDWISYKFHSIQMSRTITISSRLNNLFRAGVSQRLASLFYHNHNERPWKSFADSRWENSLNAPS